MTVRKLLEQFGWTVHRWPTTRFEGMRDALLLLRRRGYEPRIVIDCGANVGQWLQMAEEVFPGATFHSVEPQVKCVAALTSLKKSRPLLHIHHTVVTEPGVATVRMLGGGDGAGTGNFVAKPGESDVDEISAAATTLDALFGDTVRKDHRALLKLDVERHEIEVLRGATRLLRDVEVVLSETGVYDVAGDRSVFRDLMVFMDAEGFVFYDVACLSGRARDLRLRQMDVVFVRRDSDLVREHDWA